MNDQEYLELSKQAQALRSNSPEEAIALLKDAFDSAKGDLLAISGLLSDHYARAGMHDAVEEQSRLRVRLFPDEPLAWTGLTEFLIYTKEDLDEAEQTVAEALKHAERTGEYVRLCYNSIARIARRRKDYRKVEECLRFLIDYRPAQGKRDINYEKDFLVDIDEAKIDTELMKKYLSLAKS